MLLIKNFIDLTTQKTAGFKILYYYMIKFSMFIKSCFLLK